MSVIRFLCSCRHTHNSWPLLSVKCHSLAQKTEYGKHVHSMFSSSFTTKYKVISSYYKSSSASETIIVSACKKIFVAMIIETVTLFCSLYVIMIIGIGEL